MVTFEMRRSGKYTIAAIGGGKHFLLLLRTSAPETSF